MKIEIKAVTNEGISCYQEDLEKLEKNVRYPLGQDYFTIDHGLDYRVFFNSIGKPVYFLYFEQGQLMGVLVAIEKKVYCGGQKKMSVYLADLKVHPAARYVLPSVRLFRFCLENAPHYFEVDSVSFVYFVSMQSNFGDFTNKIKTKHLKEFKEISLFNIYFLDQKSRMDLLESTDIEDALEFEYMYLSPENTNKIKFSTKGNKDIKLISSGEMIEFIHFSPSMNTSSQWWLDLFKLMKEMGDNEREICLAIDVARKPCLKRMEAKGIMPSGSAKLYGMHYGIDIGSKNNTYFLGTYQI